MPLDRIIVVGFKANDQAPVSRTERLWAQRQSTAVEAINVTLGTTGSSTFVDYRVRWRLDLETTLPSLLVVVDPPADPGSTGAVEYSVDSVSFDERRRSFITLHCRREAEA